MIYGGYKNNWYLFPGVMIIVFNSCKVPEMCKCSIQVREHMQFNMFSNNTVGTVLEFKNYHEITHSIRDRSIFMRNTNQSRC